MKNLFGAITIVLFVVLAGCGESATPSAADLNKGGAASGGKVLISAAGATFPYPIYSKWFNEYRKKFPQVEINYQSIGSGGGVRQVTEGTVDFGASDMPMTDEQLGQAKTKIFHFPTVLGAVVPAYNIPGVAQELSFTPEALAGIFLGKIKKWNDPAITKANAGVTLPAKDIVVIHRAEGSGTTFVWVDYLSKISPEWKSKVGVNSAVNWPVGLGGKGNEGVAGAIQQTPNSLGYVELIYAIQNNMPYAKVENSSGKFVKADLMSVTAAAAGAAKQMPEDFRVSITNPPGAEAYPIASFTWLLIPSKIQDEAKKKAIKDFLQWMLTDGQNMVEALSYAKLPSEVVAMEQKTIGAIE
jgi:phosphate transport system substrate-binding protein